MSNDTLTLICTENGEVSTNVPVKWFGTIISDKAYAIVKEGTKPYVKKTYKPRTPKVFAQDHPEKVVDPYPSSLEDTE